MNARIAVMALVCSLPVASHAAPAPEPAPEAGDAARALDAIVVTASKTEEAAGDSTATVSVIDAEDIERRLVRDIKDLVRYEPGVSVGNDATRFGLAGFSIRGLGGNRVAIELDGVPQADAFAIGSFSAARRDSVDVDVLKQVEIVRGPGSALYGSDALGGVVGFVTKDAEDFLGSDGTYARLRATADQLDDGRELSGLATSRRGPWSVLALVSHGGFGERDNRGEIDREDATRTRPNPQEGNETSALVKFGFTSDPAHRIGLTVDAARNDVETEVFSALRTTSLGPSLIRTEVLRGDDRFERERVSVDYRGLVPTALWDDLHAQLHTQSSRTQQDTFERRTTIAVSGAETPVTRERRFLFDQAQDGAELTLRKDLLLGSTEHRLVYGAEWLRSDTEQSRDGVQTNLITGSVTSNIAPDDFPVRDFPLSRTDELAFYLQDRIRLAAGRLDIVPGLRWDSIELEPRNDPVFAADNPGVVPAAVDYGELSPRLGAQWHLTSTWSLVAQWSEGFRAPPYSDVNIGFTNLQFGYTALPNPDLRPEQSRGLEVGTRWRGDVGYAVFTVFRTSYDDFIESLVGLGVDPATGLLVFQSQNLTEVEIQGAELRLAYAPDAWSGWRADAALSYTRGEDLSRDVPLESIDPARGVLGVGYTTRGGRWDLELVASATQRKRRVDDSAGQPFQPPGHVLLDFFGEWRATGRLRFNLALRNVLDKRAWDWADVRGRLAADPTIDRYTLPGRTLGLSVAYEF